jgi:NAD(P)-dependent dehydrogenase (short-subunit alcohol dehydrogenase family)
VLVTGCSSGIGHHAAHGLAARGWRVLATCRAEADCERLRAEGLESFPLDYASPESVARGAAEALERTGGRLDALFNNGAHATPGAVEDLPRDALAAILEVNLLGPHDLTRRVIPAMRAAGRGRIVNCSSVLGFAAVPWRGAYNATKFAMEGLTDTLRLELRDTPLHVVLIEPGPIASRIRENSVPHFERWIDWRASALADRYEAELIPRLHGAQPGQRGPEAVTRRLIRALEAPRPRARYRVTPQTHMAEILRRLAPTALRDTILSRG